MRSLHPVWKLAAVSLALFTLSCAESAPVEPRVFMASFNADVDPADNFGSPLSAASEVPPNDSRARGNAIFTLSDDGTELHYKLIVANLDNVTQAHIHLANEGVNGPVVVFLFGFVAGGVSENGVLAEGTITQANLIPRPAIGFAGTMAELIAAMRAGGAYVNAHTVALPGGEIRGQIAPHGPK